MKKSLLIVLCAALLLCTACIKIYVTPAPTDAPTEQPTAQQTAQPTELPTAEPTEEPTVLWATEPTPKPTEDPAPYVPDLSMLPYQYDMPWYETQGDMLTVDLDFDGTAETYSYHINEDTEYTTIYADGRPVYEFSYGNLLSHVIFVDLDPNTPYANLLLVMDWGSEDYVTTELHPENGVLVAGAERSGIFLEDGMLIEYLQTDILGTKFGSRQVATEQLVPYSEWIECRVPTKNDWTVDRQDSIAYGLLLHAVRDVECTVDGQKTFIKAGTYLYMVRFNDARTRVEVCTEDGMHAMLDVEYLQDEWTYLLNGVPQDDLFDNLLYAD